MEKKSSMEKSNKLFKSMVKLHKKERMILFKEYVNNKITKTILNYSFTNVCFIFC